MNQPPRLGPLLTAVIIVAVRQLFPEPIDDISVADAYGEPRGRHGDGRPWVGLCMVASLDGSTVVAGRSGGLGNATDAQVLGTLRSFADVVLVGASTARAEGYGPPKRDGLRVGVVTRGGRVDTGSELFRSGSGFLVLPEDGPATDVDCVRAGQGRVDLALALRRLDTVVPGVRFVQAEGGPSLNGSLLAIDAIDELNLTWSPRLVGGNGSRLVDHAPELDARFDLARLLVDDDGFMFTRWSRRRQGSVNA